MTSQSPEDAGSKSIARHRELFVERLKRIDRDPDALGFLRSKRIRRAIFDFWRPLKQRPYFMEDAAIKAEINAAIDEYNLQAQQPVAMQEL